MSAPARDCPIIGAWQLVDYEIRMRTGAQAGRPKWVRSRGQLLYTPEGQMSVHINSDAQTAFRAERRWDGSQEEKAQAFDDYLGYGGTFRWHGDRVVHVIEHSVFPNWVGTEQIRMAHLDGDQLVLTDHEARADAAVILIWERRAG